MEKFNQEKWAVVCKNISTGLEYEDVAKESGISFETFNAWKKKVIDEKGGKLSECYEIMIKAINASLVLHVVHINNHVFGNYKSSEYHNHYDENGIFTGTTKITKTEPSSWEASAWFLERRFPEEYGQRCSECKKRLTASRKNHRAS